MLKPNRARPTVRARRPDAIGRNGKIAGIFSRDFFPTSRVNEYAGVLGSWGIKSPMKKILSTVLLASALGSLLVLASSPTPSRLAAAGQTAQFQLADDPPILPPPPPGSGDDGEKYA